MRTLLTCMVVILATAVVAVAQDSSAVGYLRVLAEVGPDSSSAITLSNDSGTVQFEATPVLTLSHVKKAVIEESGIEAGYYVFLQLTDEGSERLLAETTRRTGQRLGVVIAGKLMIAPIVQAPVSKRFPLNPTAFQLAEATALAEDLNARIEALEAN